MLDLGLLAKRWQVAFLVILGGCLEVVVVEGKRCDAEHACPGVLVCVEGVCRANNGGGAGGGMNAGGGATGGGMNAGGGATGGGSPWKSGFTAAMPMIVPRQFHTATLLPSGKVLMVGGESGSNVIGSTEFYDPIAGSTPGPPLASRRFKHVAVLLPDGRVVVAGDDTHVEILVPDAGVWIDGGHLAFQRQSLSAAYFPNLAGGRILFQGAIGAELSSELYDPNTGVSIDAGALSNTQAASTFVALDDNNAMFVALYGEQYSALSPGRWISVSFTSSPATRHNFGASKKLADGRVLVTAGVNSSSAPNLNTEIGNPLTDSFRFVGQIPEPRAEPLIARLGDRGVLVASGSTPLADGGSDDEAESTAARFDVSTEKWTDAGVMKSPHLRGTITELPGGAVLLCGGRAVKTSSLSHQRCEVFSD